MRRALCRRLLLPLLLQQLLLPPLLPPPLQPLPPRGPGTPASTTIPCTCLPSLPGTLPWAPAVVLGPLLLPQPLLLRR
jgi:hypothetical protein